LSEAILKRSVLKQLHSPAAYGMDYGAAAADGRMLVTASASRPLGTKSVPAAGVYAAVNNLVCSGAEPLGVSVTLLLPTSASENTLRDWIAAIAQACEKEDVLLLSGHTEVVRSVTEPVLSVTAVGQTAEPLVRADGARPDMDVLMTKWAGLEGTVMLAAEHAELRGRFSQPFLDRAMSYIDYLSIRSEAAVAAQSGVAAMHDVSEGGIFGALWELGSCSGVGLEIDLKSLPIRQETVEICEFFDLNPYKLLGGGSLLLAAENGNALLHAFAAAGIPAALIGRTTADNDRVLLKDGERRFLETTQTDEMWRIEK